jgi:transketolase
MRIAFINTVAKAAKKNSEVMLVTADLGFNAFEAFKDAFPSQYLNVGVAEQNMTGVCAGLSLEGKIPFAYSIIPFSTMRNFEQIRNDICYQNLNVKIVGVGSGFSYGPYAHTHHGLEDIGIMRTLPNLTIFSPADPLETAFVTNAAIKIRGPVYIRLGKAGEPSVNPNTQRLKIGKFNIIRDGDDIAVFTTGSITPNVLRAADILNKRGLDIKVYSVHTIKPLDIETLNREAKKMKMIVTVEEHFLTGGLGSAVAELIGDNQLKVGFKRIGVPNRFTKKIGLQEYMRASVGLSPQGIADSIQKSYAPIRRK